MFDLKELLANAFAGHIVRMLGIPGVIGLAAAGLVGWKLMQGARKPMLLLALLGIGAAMTWYFWRKGGSIGIPGQSFLSGLLNPPTPPPPPGPEQPTGPAPEAAQQPPYAAVRDYWRQKARYAASLPMKPLPRYTPARKGEPPPDPLTWPQRHAAAIRKLEADRWVNITRTPESYREYLDPAAREQRHRERLAKESARKRGETLIARADEPRQDEERRAMPQARQPGLELATRNP